VFSLRIAPPAPTFRIREFFFSLCPNFPHEVAFFAARTRGFVPCELFPSQVDSSLPLETTSGSSIFFDESLLRSFLGAAFSLGAPSFTQPRANHTSRRAATVALLNEALDISPKNEAPQPEASPSPQDQPFGFHLAEILPHICFSFGIPFPRQRCLRR